MRLPCADTAKSRLDEPNTQLDQRNTGLDVIRVLAALLVFVGHLRGLFFVDSGKVSRWDIPSILAYGSTRLGREAVLVFFSLSGFLVGGAALAAYGRGKWSTTQYLVTRFTRLYVVVLPALLITLVVDSVGRLANSAVYDRSLLPFTAEPFSQKLTATNFLGCMLFLQGIATDTFGSNGPLWSLAYEFWYYIAFPVFLVVIFARKQATRLTAIFGLLIIGFWVGQSISLRFSIWLTGAAAASAAARMSSSKSSAASVLISALAVGTSIVFMHKFGFAGEFAVGASTAWLAYTLRLRGRGWGTRGRYFAAQLADSSFTIYAVHFPLLLLIRAFVPDSGYWQPDGRHLLLALAVCLVTLLACILVSLFTEHQTPGIRRRLIAHLEADA